jgi:hypothetical protein
MGAGTAYAILLVLSPRQTMVYRSAGWLLVYTSLLFLGIGLWPRSALEERRSYDIGDWFFARQRLGILLVLLPTSTAFSWSASRVAVPLLREIFWLYLYTLLLLGSCAMIAWFLRQQRAEHIGMMKRSQRIWEIRLEDGFLWLHDGQKERTYPLPSIRHGQWIFDEREGSHPDLVDTIQLFFRDGSTLQIPASALGAIELLRFLREHQRLEEIPLTLS